MAEILEQANVTWRVYQEKDNFDDNGLAWFYSFMTAKPDSNLYKRGTREYKHA